MASKKKSSFVVETRSLDRIAPYPKNARKIPQAAIDKVALSLKTYGWRQPIVVDKRMGLTPKLAKVVAHA